MKRTIWLMLLAALLLLAGCAGGTGEETGTKPNETDAGTAVPPEEIPDVLPLAAEGKTDYVIVYGKDAGDGERMAAEELQNYLLQITGAEFPVVTDETPEKVREIIVGKTNRERDGEFPWEEIGEDGLFIRTDRGKLWLIGKGRGAFYAVYAFLEEYLGWRCFGEGMEVVPSLETIELQPIAENKQIAGFAKRCTTYSWSGSSILKVRANGTLETTNRTWGKEEYDSLLRPKEVMQLGWAHTMAIYAGTGNGGSDGKCDPCLSSEETFEKTMKAILTGEGEMSAMLGRPLQSNPDVTYLLLSQGDYSEDGCCHCDECMARVEKYGWSGHHLLFVNRVAEALKDDYPNLKIYTYAYNWTIEPPKGGVKAADNVYIYMCIDDACYSHPFSECTLGSHGEVYDVEAIMNGWMEATDHPFDIWYYPHTKNTQMPNMSIWTMRENARLLADHNTAFVSMMTNVNGHYEALRAYLGFKLYWNPYMSEEEFERHMNEFLQYYYGPSWEKVREYFDLLKAYADEGNHQFCWAQETIELYPFTVDDSNAAGEVPIVPVEQLRDYENVDWSPYYQALTVVVENEIVTKGRPILEAALALAETDEQRKRVDELMIEVDMVGSYSQRKLLNDIAWATASKVFENSCDAAVGAGTMNKTEAKRLIGAFEDYIVDKTLEEYHEYNRKLAQKIYDSGYPTYRSGWDVPENVEELYLDNVPTGSSGKTWYRNNT